jgi:benzylsuccinate synthase
MPLCKECKKFFPIKEDLKNGDCVERTVDPRQAYYKAKPAVADKDASSCSSFEKK